MTATAMALLIAAAAARDGGSPYLERFEVLVSPPEVRAGDTAVVVFHMAPKEGWHLYPANGDPDLAPTFSFGDAPIAIGGRIREPQPVEFESGGLRQQVLEGDVRYEVPVRIESSPPAGPLRVRGQVDFLVCSADQCVRETLPFEFDLTILPGSAQTPTAPPDASERSEAGRTFLGLLALAIGGGFLSLITPCVFPMVPIGVMYFVKQSGGDSARTAGLAITYSAGIVASYTGLGLFLTLVAGATGAQYLTSSPWVNLALAAVLIAFALSFFGVFELTLPAGIAAATSKGPRSGLVGAFVLGMTFAVASFSCTAPIAGTILALAAAGNYGWSVPAMLAYSTALASPFLVFGFAPGLSSRLPRGGGWLHESKIVGGFLLAAVSTKFLVTAFDGLGIAASRDVVLIVWILCFGLPALYLLGLFRWKGDEPVTQVGFGRALTASVFAGIALYLMTGLDGRPLGPWEGLLPAPATPTAAGAGTAPTAREEIAWETDHDAALALARAQNRPVFLDFTGFQ